MKDNENRSILEKIFLAGIGSMAASTDKMKVLLSDLVAEGNLTVEQGKVINEELQHTVKAKTVEKVIKPINEKIGMRTVENIETLSDEELTSLKERVLQIESERQNKANT